MGIRESFFKNNTNKLENSMQPNNKGYILAKFSDLLSWAGQVHCGLCHSA